MKPLKDLEASETRKDILKAKRMAGLIYGMVGGLTFAVASWGWDTYITYKSHVYLPWLGLTIAAIYCGLIGGLVGWLAARTENSLLSAVLWFACAPFMAWLAIALPLKITPIIISQINPQLGGLLNYNAEVEFGLLVLIAFAWITPFAAIYGTLQTSITDASVFSASGFGKILPYFFSIVIMGLSGFIVDSLVNAHFRDALDAMDKTIQFTLDNRNNPALDKTLARQMRMATLNGVKEQVTETRYLFVRSFDNTLGDFHILVKFDQAWVDCEVLYNQPVLCEAAEKK